MHSLFTMNTDGEAKSLTGSRSPDHDEGNWQDSVPLHADPAIPRRMRYADLPTVTKTHMSAFEDDPVHHYLLHTPDAHDTVFANMRERIALYAVWMDFVHKRYAWTIDDGEAVVSCHDPARAQGLAGKSWNKLIQAVQYLVGLSRSAEQRKRHAEPREKLKHAAQQAFGDSIKDMFQIGVLGTSPSKQGRGYGSILVRLATSMADAQSRPTFLVSSNTANTGFYEHLGFVTIVDILLGDTNPTWKHPPVLVKLMVREARNSADPEEK